MKHHLTVWGITFAALVLVLVFGGSVVAWFAIVAYRLSGG